MYNYNIVKTLQNPKKLNSNLKLFLTFIGIVFLKILSIYCISFEPISIISITSIHHIVLPTATTTLPYINNIKSSATPSPSSMMTVSVNQSVMINSTMSMRETMSASPSPKSSEMTVNASSMDTGMTLESSTMDNVMSSISSYVMNSSTEEIMPSSAAMVPEASSSVEVVGVEYLPVNNTASLMTMIMTKTLNETSIMISASSPIMSFGSQRISDTSIHSSIVKSSTMHTMPTAPPPPAPSPPNMVSLCTKYNTIIDDTRLKSNLALCDLKYYEAVRFKSSTGQNLQLRENCSATDQLEGKVVVGVKIIHLIRHCRVIKLINQAYLN